MSSWSWTHTYPADTRESEPSTTPTSNSTAMMVVCKINGAAIHLFTGYPETAVTFKDLVVAKMSPTHPCCHLFRQHFWPRFFQHSDALQCRAPQPTTNRTVRGGSGDDTRASAADFGLIHLCIGLKMSWFCQINSTNLSRPTPCFPELNRN